MAAAPSKTVKKAALIVAALLACGSLLLSTATLATGQTASYADGCTLTLSDYSATAAFIELDCGQPTQAFIALNESIEYQGVSVTLQSLGQGNATFSFKATARKKITTQAEALDAARAFVSRYPAESLEIEGGVDCDGRRGAGKCWAVSGHEKISVPATNQTPAYERLTGAAAFVDEYGEIVRLVSVT